MSAYLRDNWPWIAGLIPVLSALCATLQRQRLGSLWRSWRDVTRANARATISRAELVQSRLDYDQRITNLNQALLEKDQRIASLAAALDQLVKVSHLVRAEVDAGRLTTLTDSSTSPTSSPTTSLPSSEKRAAIPPDRP